MEEEQDQDILTSLGASAVECGTFEQNFMKKLEEHFDSLENDKETEEGELLESSPKEAGYEAGGDEGGCRADAEVEKEDTITKPPVEIAESGFSFLRRALESQGSQSLTTKSTGSTEGDSKLKSGPKVLQPSKSKNVGKKPGSQILLLQNAPAEESAEELKIRTGEMTPFGTVITRSEGGPKASFLDFSKYLNSQKAFEKNWKKPTSKSGAGTAKAQRIAGESSKEVSTKKKPATTGKDPIKYDVLFPKKRKHKEDLGTKASTSSGTHTQLPGLLPSESTSTYVNAEEDSDYEPPRDSDDEWTPDEKRPKLIRRSKVQKKRKTYKEAETDDSFSEGEEERQHNKRTRRETDDGDYKFYKQRVQNWKENETRFTGDVQTLSDGFKLPKHIWESLYDYQKVGVNWLWELHQKNCGGILGDEMGLGKTIQIIAFLAGLSCSNLQFRFTRGLGPTIVVCPVTVMHQWVKEFHTWWPPFRVVILHESGSYSGSKQGLIRSVAESNGVLITSYSGIVNNQSEILKHTWHYVILDEGHKIRNPDALVTLTVKQIPTAHRIILSGSPLQNNLKELWSLFDFVFPGKLGTLPAFMEQFAVPITQGGYANASEIQVAAAYKCAKILRDIINPYLLRRMKADVKDHVNLPPKSEQVLFCKMTDAQKACYINYLQSKEIDSIVQGRFNLFVGLINLRKICNHPHLFDGGPKLLKKPTALKKNVPAVKCQQRTGASSSSLGLPSSYHSLKSEVSDNEEVVESDESDIELDPHGSFGHWSKSGKMIVLETLLKLWKKQNHKVLLFSQSRQMLCILENFVKQENYSYLRLDGSTTIGSRQPLIQKFNEDPSIFIFILTTKVGGLGVNLTGANRVVIFDPDWNPSTDLQARERAWRIGQERQVTIYRLITSGTIEEKIYHRQIFKQFLTNRVLKDPKHRRFFKATDVLELFSFNEGHEKGTESEAIFAGTGSAVDMKALKRRRESLKEKLKEVSAGDSLGNNPNMSAEDPREKSTGKLKGVPNLVKQRTQKHEDKKEDEVADPNNDERQDDYVLRKLFRKSGVHAALKHDKIVDTGESDYVLVEKEAERVAAEAVAVLKRSREQCWSAESGRATWTGHHGVINDTPPPPKKRLRMGPKKPETVISKPVEKEPPSYFSGVTEAANDSEILSSAELIAAIRARKRKIDPITGEEPEDGGVNGNPPRNQVNLDLVDPEHVELLREIREYIAFRAQVDGQASTSELVNEFGNKLPCKDSPLFKHMLSELCSFRRVDGHGIWKLKPEFR